MLSNSMLSILEIISIETKITKEEKVISVGGLRASERSRAGFLSEINSQRYWILDNIVCNQVPVLNAETFCSWNNGPWHRYSP